MITEKDIEALKSYDTPLGKIVTIGVILVPLFLLALCLLNVLMASSIGSITYFDKPGKENTEPTLQIAKERAEELGLRQVLIASTSGDTGRRGAEVFADQDLVVVSHSAGFSKPNFQALTEENREAILANGARVLTCQHAFGGDKRGHSPACDKRDVHLRSP